MLFFESSFTGAYLSDVERISNNTITAGTWEVPSVPGEIVLNEAMINPPGGEESFTEWVELYNKGGSSVDVNGWYLYDSIDSHALEITAANVTGGSTVVVAGGYLVVNRNGDADFSLNNGTDSIRLFNGSIFTGSLIDNFSYTSNTIENKTWAKIPDGIGAWQINRVPTSGGSNV